MYKYKDKIKEFNLINQHITLHFDFFIWNQNNRSGRKKNIFYTDLNQRNNEYQRIFCNQG